MYNYTLPVQMLQVFESNAEYLNFALFEEFSLPYLVRIVTEVRAALKEKGLPNVPMVCNISAWNLIFDDYII